jgi:hypothetical protein
MSPSFLVPELPAEFPGELIVEVKSQFRTATRQRFFLTPKAVSDIVQLQPEASQVASGFSLPRMWDL